jgi:hypothetical protein
VIKEREELIHDHETYDTLQAYRLFYKGEWLLGYKRKDNRGVDYWRPTDDDEVDMRFARDLSLGS